MKSPDDSETEHAPGWDAIDAALRALYPDAEPHHVRPQVPAMLGGNDPLDGISAYRSEHGGTPHWHLVSYGLSELYGKETDDPATSGFGFELTMRVIDETSGNAPPAWAFSLFQNLARYVFTSGNAFAPGHQSALNGPIALGRETELCAAAFTEDRQLGHIETPHGALTFVQLVGLTQDEIDAVRGWDTEAFLALRARTDPALLTDVARSSWLADPAFLAEVEAGTAGDGSSTGAIFGTKGELDLAARPAVLGVAANVLGDLGRAMRGRLDHDRDFVLVWSGGEVRLCPGEATLVDAGSATLTLSPDDRAAIVELPIQRGDYLLPSGALTVRVLPVDILDGTRTRVERTIG